MRTVAAATLALFSLTVSGQAACSVYPFRFTLGIDTSTSAISDGGPCRIVLNVTRGGPIYSTKITSLPMGGVVSVDGRTTVRYRPKAGFRGEDRFDFQWIGKQGGITPMAATVHVTVTVK